MYKYIQYYNIINKFNDILCIQWYSHDNELILLLLILRFYKPFI